MRVGDGYSVQRTAGYVSVAYHNMIDFVASSSMQLQLDWFDEFCCSEGLCYRHPYISVKAFVKSFILSLVWDTSKRTLSSSNLVPKLLSLAIKHDLDIQRGEHTRPS